MQANVIRFIQEIANLATSSQRNVMVDGKPLLLFYVNRGTNVMKSCTQLEPAFANIRPTPQEWNPMVNTTTNQRLHDIFTVRFLAYTDTRDFDYSSTPDVWPFLCELDCKTTEAGADLSLFYKEPQQPSYPFNNRTVNGPHGFNARVNQANADLRKFMFVRTWNEFSGGDEEVIEANATHGRVAQARTIEPNTVLHLYDGSNDPFYFFNEVKKTLNSVKAYRVRAQHSGLCLTVGGGPDAHNAPMIQSTCLEPKPKSQIFYVKSLGAGNNWQLSPAHNGSMCFDVTGNSGADGALIQQYPCLGGPPSNQTFQLFGIGTENLYEIVTNTPTSNQKCLDVVGVSTSPGAYIQQYQCLNSANQRWYVEPIFR